MEQSTGTRGLAGGQSATQGPGRIGRHVRWTRWGLVGAVAWVCVLSALAHAAPLRVTVLGGGPQDNQPLANIRVLRHDPVTGVVVGDLLSNASGVADFGEIGSSRTTLSLVTTRTMPSDDQRKQIFTFMNVLAGAYTLNAASFGEVDRPPLSTVDVTMTSIPSGTSQVRLFTGGFQSDNIVPGGPSATVPGFTVTQLQSDSTFSLLGVAVGPDGVQEIGCGSAVDLAPATTATSFPVNAAPSPIAFTASEPVQFNGRRLLRKGVIFDRSTDPVGPPTTTGSFNACGVPGTEKVAADFTTAPHPVTASQKNITRIVVPPVSSLTLTLPSLSIDSLSRSPDGKTITWTRSGADLGKLDFAAVERKWTSGSIEYRWVLVGNPATSTSLTLPALPSDLADRVPPPGIHIGLQLGGLDNVAGFDDFTEKFTVGGFASFEALLFQATAMIGVGRDLPSTAPVCDIQLNNTSFVNGNQVIAQVARLANPGPDPVPVEVKLWFEVPGSPPVPFLTVGADGSFVLSPGSNHDYGPLDLATVQASYPRGPYEFNCRLLHAVTGAPLGEDFNPFQLQ